MPGIAISGRDRQISRTVDRLGPWPARCTWLALPLLIGPVLGDGLDGASDSVQWVASIGLWSTWAGVLVATLVPRGTSLTALRIAVPAAALAVLVASFSAPAASVALGAVGAIASLVGAFLPTTGEAFVDGESYGDERRFPLRVPGPLLAGPVVLAWAAVVVGVTAGPLFLAARQWVVGVVLLAAGLPLAWRAVKTLHVLSTRWLVVVPAGVVLHDPLALADPVLFRRQSVKALEPAVTGTEALDLTGGALGLALEVQLVETVPLPTVAKGRRAETETVDTTAFLFTPSRPGALLAATRSRRIG
jgi:hypothetical protein